MVFRILAGRVKGFFIFERGHVYVLDCHHANHRLSYCSLTTISPVSSSSLLPTSEDASIAVFLVSLYHISPMSSFNRMIISPSMQNKRSNKPNQQQRQERKRHRPSLLPSRSTVRTGRGEDQERHPDLE